MSCFRRIFCCCSSQSHDDDDINTRQGGRGGNYVSMNQPVSSSNGSKDVQNSSISTNGSRVGDGDEELGSPLSMRRQRSVSFAPKLNNYEKSNVGGSPMNAPKSILRRQSVVSGGFDNGSFSPNSSLTGITSSSSPRRATIVANESFDQPLLDDVEKSSGEDLL